MISFKAPFLIFLLAKEVHGLSFHKVTRRQTLVAAPTGGLASLLTAGTMAPIGARAATSPSSAAVAATKVVRGDTVKLVTGEDFPLASFGLQV